MQCPDIIFTMAVLYTLYSVIKMVKKPTLTGLHKSSICDNKFQEKQKVKNKNFAFALNKILDLSSQRKFISDGYTRHHQKFWKYLFKFKVHVCSYSHYWSSPDMQLCLWKSAWARPSCGTWILPHDGSGKLLGVTWESEIVETTFHVRFSRLDSNIKWKWWRYEASTN